MEKKGLPLLSTANQLLAEFIPILTVSYHLVTKLYRCYIDVIYILYRCSRICSDCTKFHLKLVKLTDVSKDNGCPEKFINNCFKVPLGN